MDTAYDCIVIGGGPAGSTTATLVAEAGYRTLLLEREKMPRFHIGESLMPETYWTLQRLGVLDQMQASPFVKKYSVQFVANTGKESQPFYFQERDNRECSQTWQVLRSEFDQMLWDNAAAKGAECRDETRVLDVLMTGDQATGVRCVSAAGATREHVAKVVVDATGQQSLLAMKFGIRTPNPRLRKAAVWGYYENARRESGIDEGATLILHTKTKDCWFWYIPLHANIVSVGVVGDVDYLLKGRGQPATIFEEELCNCPAVLNRLVDAKLVSEFRILREFSYNAARPSGDGWVLVGDAYAFLDPIYSSGVFLALKSGEMAADAIVEGLRNGDTSAGQLGKWADEFDLGLKWIAKLVYAFYTRDFSFGKFTMQHPEHKGGITDLLVGKVFSQQAGAVFDDLEPWMARASEASGEPSPSAASAPTN